LAATNTLRVNSAGLTGAPANDIFSVDHTTTTITTRGTTDINTAGADNTNIGNTGDVNILGGNANINTTAAANITTIGNAAAGNTVNILGNTNTITGTTNNINTAAAAGVTNIGNNTLGNTVNILGHTNTITGTTNINNAGSAVTNIGNADNGGNVTIAAQGAGHISLVTIGGIPTIELAPASGGHVWVRTPVGPVGAPVNTPLLSVNPDNGDYTAIGATNNGTSPAILAINDGTGPALEVGEGGLVMTMTREDDDEDDEVVAGNISTVTTSVITVTATVLPANMPAGIEGKIIYVIANGVGIEVNGVPIADAHAQGFIYDGTSWIPLQ